MTAMIPAFFGIPIAILGVVSHNEKYRMHAMHFAVLIGFIGLLGGGGMGIKGLVTRGLEKRPVAVWLQLGMGAVCAAFVVLCVKSFIDVRKAREAAKQAEPSSSGEASNES